MSKTKKKNNDFLFSTGITKQEKAKKARYLTKRINELFENISEWIKDLKNYSLKKTNISVEGEKLPSLDIYSSKKIIVSFKPTGLWAFGVNCRIDLVSGKETNVILDVAKENSEPDWQFISSEAGKKPKKLTKIIFRNLLKKINT